MTNDPLNPEKGYDPPLPVHLEEVKVELTGIKVEIAKMVAAGVVHAGTDKIRSYVDAAEAKIQELIKRVL